MALVPGHHVDLVALDLPTESDLGLAFDDALTERLFQKGHWL
jgi:hypothetical protein